MSRSAALALLALAALAGVRAVATEPPRAQAAEAQRALVVEDAWVRQPPPGAKVAAAYFTARNASPRTLAIVAVESPAAAHAMLHETTIESGQARMRPRERIEIAPGQSVALRPGGLHVMLHGLARTLEVGERVPLVLRLEDGARIEVSAQVRPPGGV